MPRPKKEKHTDGCDVHRPMFQFCSCGASCYNSAIDAYTAWLSSPEVRDGIILVINKLKIPGLVRYEEKLVADAVLAYLRGEG
ncbi:MAG: hypothetical protein A4E53_01643 [Pelotomaculum sp. PtaB.Bin104]|nr:MAG: hypothetical protein A4E53_01643 [Pelotomaculum sp. PtaB.Bin104]